MARTAVVLMNLGGPDSPAAVRPFLMNLFSDPAIIRLPWVLRAPLAWLIASRRAQTAATIYARLGGASPLLANTQAQACALETRLGSDYRTFVAMRYWHPTSIETARQVARWEPDEVPLYPQFSTTTTASSLSAWGQAARAAGLACPTRVVCCYPDEAGFVAALADLIRPALAEARGFAKPPRLLLTAHGLPQKIVDRGDPYQAQVERTARAVIAVLDEPELDWRVCYQSRVGPLAWIGPETETEIRRAGSAGVPLVVAPISFVSEHSETLVELDYDYRAVAQASGVPAYVRVPTVGVAPDFIAALALLVERARPAQASCSAVSGGRCVRASQSA